MSSHVDFWDRFGGFYSLRLWVHPCSSKLDAPNGSKWTTCWFWTWRRCQGYVAAIFGTAALGPARRTERLPSHGTWRWDGFHRPTLVESSVKFWTPSLLGRLSNFVGFLQMTRHTLTEAQWQAWIQLKHLIPFWTSSLPECHISYIISHIYIYISLFIIVYPCLSVHVPKVLLKSKCV